MVSGEKTTMTITALFFNGTVQSFADGRHLADAFWADSKGIAFADRAEYDAGMANAKSEFLVSLYNTIVNQALLAGRPLPNRMAKLVKKFENRLLAVDRVYRLAMSLVPGAPAAEPVSVEAAPAEVCYAQNHEPELLALLAAEPAPVAPAGIHLVEPPQDTLTKALEGAEAAALANPTPSVAERASDIPDHGAPTPAVVEYYAFADPEMTIDTCPAEIVYCPACTGTSGLVIDENHTQVIACNNCGWKLGDVVGQAPPTPIQPTIEVNEMAKKTTAPAPKGKATKTAKAPAKATKTTPAPKPAKADKAERVTKQDQVIEMLKAKKGTTIAAVIEITGWQPHTCRGFFAGACAKLGFTVTSSKADKASPRIYRIAS